MRSRFRRHLLVWLVLMAGLAGAPAAARADTITLNLGFISFDEYIPGDPGTATFTAWNFAGVEETLGFDPATEFLIRTPVAWQNLSVLAQHSDDSAEFEGGFSTPVFPGMASTAQFSQVPPLRTATFRAFLSTTLLEYWVADGMTAWVDLPTAEITAQMWPTSEGILTDGDFALVTVSGTVVPEPATLLLLGSGLATVLGARKFRGRRRLS